MVSYIMDFKRIQWQRECLRLGWSLKDLTALWNQTADLDLWVRWITFCEEKPQHVKHQKRCAPPKWALEHYQVLQEEKSIYSIDWNSPHIIDQNIEYILTEKALKYFWGRGGKSHFYNDIMGVTSDKSEVWVRHKKYIPRWAANGISLVTIEGYYRQEITAQEVWSYIGALTKEVADLAPYLIKYHIPLSALGRWRGSALDVSSASLWRHETLNRHEEDLLINAFELDLWDSLSFHVGRENPYLKYLSKSSPNVVKGVAPAKPGMLGLALKKHAKELKADAILEWKEHVLRFNFQKKFDGSVNKGWVYLCEYAALSDGDTRWLEMWTAEQLHKNVALNKWPESWFLLKNWVEEGAPILYSEYLALTPLQEERVYFA